MDQKVNMSRRTAMFGATGVAAAVSLPLTGCMAVDAQAAPGNQPARKTVSTITSQILI